MNLKQTTVAILLPMIAASLTAAIPETKMNKRARNDITVAIGSFPSDFIPLRVPSVYHYFIFEQILGNLASINAQGSIDGYLAESWEISPDKKTYNFKIRADSKWSDGKKITANDVSEHIKLGLKTGKTTHFDFENIESVKAVNEHQVQIRLRNVVDKFIFLLTTPEFGLLRASHIDNKSKEWSQLSVTSGAFFVESSNSEEIQLRRNPYWPKSSSSPIERMKIIAPEWEKVKRGLISGEIDITEVSGIATGEDDKEILSTGRIAKFQTSVAFSLFVSINGERIKDVACRRAILHALSPETFHDRVYSAIMEPARQLFLPENPGRPSDPWLDDFWKRIKSEKITDSCRKKTLRLLTPSGVIFQPRIISALQAAGFNLEVDAVDDLWSPKIKTSNYDLIHMSYDFSGVDPLHTVEEMAAGPNPALTIPKSSDFWSVIKEGKTTNDKAARILLNEKLGKIVMAQAFLAPIAHKRVSYYHRRDLEMQKHLSSKFLDMSFWKIPVATQEY